MAEHMRSLSSVGAAAVGLSATITRAREHSARLERLRLAHGETYMRRVERMYLESPWGLDKSEWMAQRLAVFEWMAGPAVTIGDAGAHDATRDSVGQNLRPVLPVGDTEHG